MAGKNIFVRALTCSAAVASLVLSALPAYADSGDSSDSVKETVSPENVVSSTVSPELSSDLQFPNQNESDSNIVPSTEANESPRLDAVSPAPRIERSNVSRLGGKDAVETSVLIARHAYPTPPRVVYIASADTLIDAVSSGSLRDGPVIFSRGNSLPDVVKRYLREVNPDKVIALGGTSVIKSSVLQQAKVSDQELGRLAGSTAVDTAIEIAKYAYPNGSARVYVTTSFTTKGKLNPDIVSGVGLHDGPILFGNRSNELTSGTRNFISSLGAQEIVQLGYNKLGTFRPNRYLAGQRLYDTSVEISKEVLKGDVHIGYLANAQNLIDGIPAGALDDGSVLLTDKDNLSYSVCEHLRTSKISKVVALGGPNAISDRVLNFANSIASGKTKKCVKPSPPAKGWRPPSRYLQPVATIKSPGSTVVPRRGWNGTKVREVRARLGVGVPLNSGMTYDARTENATKRFQRRARLRATGVVDSRTWSRLTKRSWTMDSFRMTPVALTANRSQRLNAMLSFARRQLGTPYTWGGAGGYYDGYDCSGLALQALYVAGIDPQPINVISHAAPTYRSSKELYAHPRLQRVRFASRQPGDLVFWRGRSGIYHVAIYLGSNQVIESNYGHTRQRGLYNWGSIAPYVVRPLAS